MNTENLDVLIEPMLRAARIPGAAIAVVSGDRNVLSQGFGYRDLQLKLPLTSGTVYPIGSTTKAFNATLLGMLVDEGRLAWDTPVQRYLPRFRLGDPVFSAQVTLRDLVTMRTGLPRHDWLWIDNPISRAQLVERLRHLELSAGFRERFQYNNLTVTVAGHLAEVVTGRNWEDLVRERILGPLGMDSTVFTKPLDGNATLSYHENWNRTLVASKRLAVDVSAPAGGTIHSTVDDMARWIAFNLNGGAADGQRLVKAQTLAEIHAPQVIAGMDPTAPTPHAAYAFGWFADTYNGCARLSHGGLVHDVNSSVMLFPRQGIGLVSFVNFASSRLPRLINQYVFDSIAGFEPEQTFAELLRQYEEKVANNRQRNACMRRVWDTSPSHALDEYVGHYLHPGYGEIAILANGGALSLRRNSLELLLEHWHYDVWMAAENDLFEIHAPHVFDRASPILFETGAQGAVAACCIQFEPEVSPIRFEKQSDGGRARPPDSRGAS